MFHHFLSRRSDLAPLIPSYCLSPGKRLTEKGFHNDLRRRQHRIEQARTSSAVWISAERS